MRRLNLLQQILYGQTILSLKEASATTRHLWTTLNLLNSRRGWPDLLTCSGRELLTAGGYKQSRYSAEMLKRFHSEAKEAGLLDWETTGTAPTVYFVASVTRELVEKAKATSTAKTATNEAAKLAPRLAAKLAESGNGDGGDAAFAAGNGGKIVKIRKGARGSEHGGSGGTGSVDGGDDLVRELEQLGL